MAEKSLRDQLRAKTVGKKKQFKTKEVEIEKGLKVEVREPSVAQRTKILQKAKAQSAGAKDDFDILDTGKMQVYAVIECTYTPDGEQIFEEADAESMLNTPTTEKWLDEVGEIAMNMLNVQEDNEVKN